MHGREWEMYGVCHGVWAALGQIYNLKGHV